MGHGVIHVWIMNERCRPAIGAKWIVRVYDCVGQTPYGYVSRDEGKTWTEKTLCYNAATTDPNNPHIAFKVPPGCYKVDAWQDGCQNPVHETMVVLPSLAEINVYLIAGADGWIRRILPIIPVRARLRPVPPVTPPVEPSRPPTTYAERPSTPCVALKEEEVERLSHMLRKIMETIPIGERAPIAPEVVDCLAKTVVTTEAKQALTSYRSFLVE